MTDNATSVLYLSLQNLSFCGLQSNDKKKITTRPYTAIRTSIYIECGWGGGGIEDRQTTNDNSSWTKITIGANYTIVVTFYCRAFIHHFWSFWNAHLVCLYLYILIIGEWFEQECVGYQQFTLYTHCHTLICLERIINIIHTRIFVCMCTSAGFTEIPKRQFLRAQPERNKKIFRKRRFLGG